MEATRLLIVLWIVTGGCTWLCTVGVTDVVRGPVQVNDVVCNTVQRTVQVSPWAAMCKG